MRTRTVTATLAAAALVATASPASAIRNGQPDEGEHPYVGLMVAYVEDEQGELQPGWRCSGSLLDATTYLTAGHCTSGADAVAIWFDEDLTDAEAAGYPNFADADATGTPYTHPDYSDDAFFLHDVGVVELDGDGYPLDEYAELPEPGLLDEAVARPGRPLALEAAGYGVQGAWPAQTGKSADLRLRLKADVWLINDDRALGNRGAGDYIVVSNNGTGGTCFGDSGGPVLLRDSNTVVGVNSFVTNSACGGVGGVYRVDQPDDLAWIGQFL